MPSQLRVLTYNIHKGFTTGRLRFKLNEMRTALANVNAELVFLQEVQGAHKRRRRRQEWSSEETQFEFLAHELWPHYAYGKNAIYQSGHHGNAILSKYPFSFYENINVAPVTRASRSLLHGIIDIPAQGNMHLHVICIHFGLFKTERTAQLSILKERIAETVSVSDPLIIAGDFNDWRKEATDYLERELGMKEVFKVLEGEHAKTFPAWRPTLLTDRIYFRGIQLHDGQCLNESPWTMLSDHLPLYAIFNVE